MSNEIQILKDQLILLETLYEIALGSEEAESVKLAMSALTRTQAGMNYLTSKPMTL